MGRFRVTSDVVLSIFSLLLMVVALGMYLLGKGESGFILGMIGVVALIANADHCLLANRVDVLERRMDKVRSGSDAGKPEAGEVRESIEKEGGNCP